MLKQLLNFPEAKTDSRLREVCEDFDARVFAKIRVADVLQINDSGIDNDQYRYALQAHFDFVVADDNSNPLFAVEFDGAGHSEPEAQHRDEMKNNLCDRFQFPLLRINQKYLNPDFSNWDLVRWFCTVYFIKRDWDADVESGKIPYEDSIFDPMFVSVQTKTGWHSLELENNARAEFGKLFREGKIPLHICNWITAQDGENVLRSIAWINTSKSTGVVVETAMKHHQMGDWVHFAVRGIVLNQLLDKVLSVLKTPQNALPMARIDECVDAFKNKYEMIMAAGSGSNLKFE